MHSQLRSSFRPFALAFGAIAIGTAGGQESEPAETADPAAIPTIAFLSTRDGNFEVYRWTAGEAKPVNLTRNPATDFGLSWSPDGEQIAFGTDRDGNREIYVMGSDGSDPVNITWHESDDKQPCWSPDGESLLFVSNRDHARGEIYLMDPIGAEPVRLTFNETYEEVPQWSPDGKTIAFCRLVTTDEKDEDGEIFLMDADGANQRRLTHKPGFDSSPAWSPDGKRLAFHGASGETFGLFVIDAAGGDASRLTDGETELEFYQPQWTADGERIVYSAGLGPNAYDIWVMDADGSSKRRLTTNPARDESPRIRPQPARRGAADASR